MINYAVILASGKGERFGSEVPKQFIKICAKTILEHSVEIFEQNEKIDKIIVVITPEYEQMANKVLSKYKKICKILCGGKTRKESSYIGINSIEETEANVLIHDCARPLLSQNTLNKCIACLEKYDAVSVAVPATDTIIEVENDYIKNILQRSSLRNIQTPQCFRLSLIKKAHEIAKDDNEFTDDCGLIMKHNMGKIKIVESDNPNIKITYPCDIAYVEEFFNKIIKNK